MTTKKLDKTEQAIRDQLFYNSGTHMLDSGMTNGRGWQQWNDGRKTLNFSEMVDKKNSSIRIEAYLKNCLNRSTEAIKFEKALLREMKKINPDCKADKTIQFCEQETIKEVLENMGMELLNGGNSYNFDNDLSQIIQYDFICDNGKTDIYQTKYILLSIHGGCDARGGYSDYKVYEVDIDTFYSMDLDSHGYLRTECENCRHDMVVENYNHETQEDITEKDGHICEACMADTDHDFAPSIAKWKLAVKDWQALTHTPCFEKGMGKAKPTLKEFLEREAVTA